MKSKIVKVKNGRNYVNSRPLAHIIWDHYNPDNKIRKGYLVHHKDKNPLNDNINNLQLMTTSQHMKIHNSGINNPLYERGHTEETKKKMSEQRKGKPSCRKGAVLSYETKQKISNSKIGKKASEETRKKLSDMRQGKGNSFYGKHHSVETKSLISALLSGEKHPAYGKVGTMLGKTHSDETKRKISESHKRKRPCVTM